MRVEATVPDSRGAALKELSEQLGMSKSQVIDDALSFFLMAVMEVRKGRRFMSVGSNDDARAEVMTPTLAQMQWMIARQDLNLSDEGMGRMLDLIDNPPEANDALRAALGDDT